jgi:beta-lactam-binding protein with PASTA domain
VRGRWAPWRRRRAETVEAAEPAAAETTEVVEEAPAPPPRDTLWPWLLLLLLIVLGGLAALWFFTRDTGPDKEVVPRVVGMTETAARLRIQEDRLEADVDRRPSRRPQGIVFAQAPGAGTQVAEGTRVELLVSRGPAGVAVPDFVGLKQAAAVRRLEAAGLKAKLRRVFAQKPKGVVVEQDPSTGVRVLRGSIVQLSVSKGRKTVVVPPVVGLDQQAALAALRKVDLLANVFQVPSAEPKGTVVAQNPPAGANAQAGSAVRLNVSTGSTQTTATTTVSATTTAAAGGAARAAVPRVVGLRQTAALRSLQAAHLKGSVRYVASSRPAGVVVSQLPAPGTRAARNSTVRLTVSAGPSPQARRSVPDVTGLDVESAIQTLRQAGFRVETISTPTENPDEDGFVLDQQPRGGTRAPRGSTVTIFVGQA